ncbi:MAG: tRNA-guanine transglycosylase, partial [Spirochaetes bacterium]|nr:tRNA-guanine transglycosylase [Spirochaetota bacterium]
QIIDPQKQKQFGIVQGNFYKELREESAQQIIDLDFDGYAIGGLSVGETKEVYLDILRHTTPLLPENKARYLMGVGTPIDLLTGVESGVDMFDCVFPTRIARNAAVFTDQGRINLRNEKYKFDNSPISEHCPCPACKNFSKSYIRHLFKCKEITAARLTSYHNIYYLKNLMNQIREAILNDSFVNFKEEFINKYK